MTVSPANKPKWLKIALLSVVAFAVLVLIGIFNPFAKMERDTHDLFKVCSELNEVYKKEGRYPDQFPLPSGFIYSQSGDSFTLKAPTGLTAAGDSGATLYVGDERRAPHGR